MIVVLAIDSTLHLAPDRPMKRRGGRAFCGALVDRAAIKPRGDLCIECMQWADEIEQMVKVSRV